MELLGDIGGSFPVQSLLCCDMMKAKGIAIFEKELLIMKKVKRILAILLVIILAGLYISTLVFALIGSERAMDWLKVSIYSTIVLPVLLWAYSFVYKLLKKSGEEDSEV